MTEPGGDAWRQTTFFPFAIRSLDAPTTVTIDVANLDEVAILETHTLADDDIYAKNTLADQQRVGVAPNGTATLADGRLTIELPAVSSTAIALG